MKKRLFTPGPTPVPESVMLKMAEPMIHHRHPEFTELFTRVNNNLRYLFQTSGDVLTLTSSGTGSMDAVVCNLHQPGETAVFVNGGKFGERWGEILRAYGMHAVEVSVEWGSSVSADQIADALKGNPAVKAVYLTQSETSTGAATDVKTIAREVHKNCEAAVVVDGITAVGAMELRMDEWGIDAVVTGSQKGLMIPPGLAFLALSERAWRMTEKSTLPKYYFDLIKAKKAVRDNDTPWTPAVSLVIGVDKALEMIRSEGIENVWKRHDRLARSIRSSAQALGLSVLAKCPSNALTAITIPDSLDAKAFNRTLKNKYGITVAGGQGHFKGKIIRISHLGYYDEFDMTAIVSALELTLKDCGYKFEPGVGVRAAISAFSV
ncbi:MAG: alanine--glyoxylate aminotransferase family protein [Ignavibacteriales bacterium]|nr:alanine--glyoxylate aminotransferase family protein [Ignavibacteriales bacterium]